MAETATEEKEIIELGTLVDWVNDTDHATRDSREMSEKCRNYYDSRQISDAEARVMRRRKQAPVVINRIKPKMDGLMGMERANRTTAKAYPRTPKHEKAATAATEGVRFVLDDQFFNQTRSMMFDNLIVEGTGGCEVIVKPQGNGFRIFVNHIAWDRIIYDPYSRRKDFKDALYLGQVVWLDYDIALDRFPEGEDVLQTMMQGSTTYDDKPRWLDNKRRRVKIVELYFLQGGDWYYVCFTLGGFLKPPKISPYRNEEGETEHPYEFASLFIQLEGDRYGAASQYLDVQDEINKRRSKALHLISVRQVRWERGAVEDINKAREELAKPDGVIETTPGMEFEVLKTGDMAAAQFNLLAEAKQEIDAVGYNAAASGKEPRTMSGVALKNREVAAQTELAPMFDVLKHLDIRVYRKIWNRIKQYWRDEMWIRVTDDETNLRWVGLNKPITRGEQVLQQAQESGMPPEQLAALKQQIMADPAAQQVVDTQNDVATLDVDIVIDDAPDSVTMQQEEFVALSEMVKSGVPIPPIAIVQASSLTHKDEIIKQMKQGVQLPPEMQKKVEELQTQAQTLAQENQALKADQSTDMAKLQMQHKHKTDELALTAQQADAEIANERRRMEAEYALKKEMQDKQIALDRERAEADAAIKLMVSQNDASIEKQRMDTEHANEDKRMASEQKQREFDNQHKISEQQKKDEATAAPAFAKALGEISKGFQQALEQNAKIVQAALTELKAVSASKSVSLGSIKRDGEGRLTGATATVQ